MTKQVTLENTRSGGFGLPTGQIVPGNGSIVVEPEIWDAAKDHPVVKAVVEGGGLIVDGKGRKADAHGGQDGDAAEMRARFDATISALNAELDAEKAKVVSLEAEIAALKGGSSAPEQKSFEAKHRGGGSYSIMEGEKEVREKLTKDQAEAFNALDADGKFKWLTDNPAA